MSTPSPPGPAGGGSAVPPPARGRLGAAEAAVVITAITAVTVFAVLQRPIPAVLAALVAAVCLLLLPGGTRSSAGRALGRLARLLTAVSRYTDRDQDRDPGETTADRPG